MLLVSGFIMSTDSHEVMKPFQPPSWPASCAGGAPTMAWKSSGTIWTLKPPFSSRVLAIGPALVRTGDVRGVQHHDRRAVIARLLEAAPSTGEVAAHQPVHAGIGFQRRAADEHGVAGLVILVVADHALQEVLLVEGVLAARRTFSLSKGGTTVFQRKTYCAPILL